MRFSLTAFFILTLPLFAQAEDKNLLNCLKNLSKEHSPHYKGEHLLKPIKKDRVYSVKDAKNSFYHDVSLRNKKCTRGNNCKVKRSIITPKGSFECVFLKKQEKRLTFNSRKAPQVLSHGKCKAVSKNKIWDKAISKNLNLMKSFYAEQLESISGKKSIKLNPPSRYIASFEDSCKKYDSKAYEKIIRKKRLELNSIYGNRLYYDEGFSED